METENEKLRIHFTYCVIILVLLLIGIATDRWTAQQKFTEYLSNAATMTSLVLGLVAIFYSFVANDGLSKSLGNISTVADAVKQSKDQISEYLTLTQSSTEAARENAKSIDKVSNDVTSTLSSLTEALNAVRAQTETLNADVSSLPARFDQLESKVIDATKTLGEKTQIPSVLLGAAKVDAEVATRFLETSALSCNLLTYAVVLAMQTNKPLSIKLVCEAIESKLDNFFSGFLACMDATQLVKRKLVEGEVRVYVVTSVHNTLMDNTKNYIVDFVTRAYKDKPETKASWLNKLNNLEALFA